MRNRFCNKIKSLFTANPYTIERENGPVLYAYDDKTQKRTFLTADHTNSDKSLIIHNNKRQDLIHQTFYPETNIIPTVCMKYKPESHPKRNVQRNNEKEKFRMATKLKIRIFHQYSFE